MHAPSSPRWPGLALLILALASMACQFSLPQKTAGTPQPTEVAAAALTAVPTSAVTAVSTAAHDPTTAPTAAAIPPTPTLLPTGTEPAAPTAESTPTEALPRATQPAFAGTQFEYQGVRLSVPNELASTVTAKIRPGHWGDATIVGQFGPYPDMYIFAFEGYPKLERAYDPEMWVFPIEEYEKVNVPAEMQHEMLEDILSSGVPNQGFEPYLPLRNVWQNYTTHDELLPFANGNGLRYLTTISLYNYPQGRIDSDGLFYTYQGLTADGRLYVSAVLPVQLPILDTQEREDQYRAAYGDSQKLSAYAKDAAAIIQAARPEDFTPSLTVLDAMIRSLVVAPEVVLLPPTLPNYAKNCGTPASHLQPGIRARVAFTDGLPLNVRAEPGKQGQVVAKLKEGSTLYIVQGPNCKDHGQWWKIQSDTVSGYVLESDGKAYFVEPIPR